MTEVVGWIASGFTLATFVCCQGRPLRLCALAANAAFIAYGATVHLWPVLALHAALVPINLWRLSQLQNDAHQQAAVAAARPQVDARRGAGAGALQGSVELDWLRSGSSAILSRRDPTGSSTRRVGKPHLIHLQPDSHHTPGVDIDSYRQPQEGRRRMRQRAAG